MGFYNIQPILYGPLQGRNTTGANNIKGCVGIWLMGIWLSICLRCAVC